MSISLEEWSAHQNAEWRQRGKVSSIEKNRFHEWIRETFLYPKVLFIGSGSKTCLREKYLEAIGIDPLINKYKQFTELFITPIKGVGEYLPFKDKTFDVIYSIDGLDHCRNAYKIIDEINRVLKDDGKVNFFVNLKRKDQWHQPLDEEILKEYLSKYFNIDNLETEGNIPGRNRLALYGVLRKR